MTVKKVETVILKKIEVNEQDRFEKMKKVTTK